MRNLILIFFRIALGLFTHVFGGLSHGNIIKFIHIIRSGVYSRTSGLLHTVRFIMFWHTLILTRTNPIDNQFVLCNPKMYEVTL